MNNRVHFITHTQPHRIVTYHIPKKKRPYEALATTKYITKIKNNRWKWGEMRGGSRIIQLNNGNYLTFFHSSRYEPYPGDCLRTYVIGAYVFSQYPPYHIIYMSKHPITHPIMYTGRWVLSKNQNMDYVAFPMGVIESSDKNHLYLIYGRDGWVMKIDVDKLLNSLITVESVVIELSEHKKHILDPVEK